MAVDLTDEMNICNFVIISRCYFSNCMRKHFIANIDSELKPCRLFCCLLLHDTVDTDWEYLLHGFIFGFQVINRDCSTTYSRHRTLKMDDSKKDFISNKLHTELKRGFIS